MSGSDKVMLELPKVRGWALLCHEFGADTSGEPAARSQAEVLGVAMDRLIEAMAQLDKKSGLASASGSVAASNLPASMAGWHLALSGQAKALQGDVADPRVSPYIAQVERRCRGALHAMEELSKLLVVKDAPVEAPVADPEPESDGEVI